MKTKLFLAMLVFGLLACCLQKPNSVSVADTTANKVVVVQEYLNGTWGGGPKQEYKGKPIPKEKFTWGEGEFKPGFYAFDLQRGKCLTDDGFRFIAVIEALDVNVFKIGLNKPLDHPPTEEEIAAHKAAGPDEVIVVHFVNKDKIWIELKDGFDLGKDFDPKRNIYYRYSGPGTAVKDNE